ncbi:MAG: hypothetical protein RL017_271 [Pseudomonadota bacterium]|jgi:glycosyltransferase involved in cell wall biosynthesis|nr:glycosyltransferase [Burkholderiales bacterium]
MPIFQTPENFLRQAIESILQQSYSDFELILVNDSPEDELRLHHIVNSYKDSRIIWVPCHINSGIATASNIGINQAKGDFIAMMDHDDICTPNRFDLQLKFLESHPEIGFIGGQACALYPDRSGVNLPYAIPETMEQLQQSFFNGVPFLNPSVMFRKALFQNLRYDSTYKICSDYNLFAHLVFTQNIMATNLPEVLLYYRMHDNNASFKHYLLAEQETNTIQQWILKHNRSKIV